MRVKLYEIEVVVGGYMRTKREGDTATAPQRKLKRTNHRNKSMLMKCSLVLRWLDALNLQMDN